MTYVLLEQEEGVRLREMSVLESLISVVFYIACGSHLGELSLCCFALRVVRILQSTFAVFALHVGNI